MEKLQIQKFGITKDGSKPYLYKMKNDAGMEVQVSDFGATLVNVTVLDQDKNPVEVVLGYEDAAGYENGTAAIGAIVGRNANRIGGACVTINGIDYKLAENDGKNNLHSGPDVYQKRMWRVVENGDDHVTFLLHSPDGDQGYPGAVHIEVTYTLTEDNAVKIAYHAVPDADTLINMTNHSYFNLSGHASGTAWNAKVWIDADAFTETDAELIPTGTVVPVEGTPMDFRKMKKIGQDIGVDFEQLKFVGGYDHNFVLDKADGTIQLAARARSEKSGICMDVYTDCVGIQLYAGNFIGKQTGKGGASYDSRHAFCLETQYFPNAVNEPNFKSPVLHVGETYHSQTKYCFSVK